MTTTASSTASLETLTMLGRLRGTRGLPVLVLLVLTALGLFAWQGRFVRLEYSVPDLGLAVSPRGDGRLLVTGDERWPGLGKNEELVSFDGATLDLEGWLAARRAVRLGTHEVVVLREGRPVVVRGEVGPTSLAYVLALTLRLLTGGVLFLIGFGAFLLRPGTRTSWLFLSMLLGVGVLSMMTGGKAGLLPGVYAVIMLVLAAAPAIGLHLFLLFPEPLPWVQRRPWAPALVHAPGLALALAAAVSLVRSGSVLGDSLTSGRGLELAVRVWAICCITAGVMVLVRQWRRQRAAGNARVAGLYRLLTLAMVLGLLAPAVVTALARALQLPVLVGQLSTAGIVAFALLMGLVLVRHNPLDIDRYAASVVGYVLTLSAIGAVFALGLVALPLVLQAVGLASSSEALVVLTAATSLSVQPAYQRLRRRVDRWFSREQADALQTAELLKRVVDAVQQQPGAKALDAVVDAARVLGGEAVALWQVDASGRNFVRSHVHGATGDAPLVSRQGPFAAVLEKPTGVAGLAPVTTDAATQQALWAQGLAMTAPVRAHGVPVGALGVGRRASGFGYRQEDLAFLETLAAQAGLALERGQVVTQIGRYRVERRLASGGMAEIFVAWQVGLGGFERKVALKRLLPELAEDPRYAAGLLDEARIAARLQHRNIAQTFEVGLEEGQHFIAMEFVDGPPLRALLAASKRRAEQVPLPVGLAIARALLQALHHAHEVKDASGAPLGVVHRDVTPSNVLVSNAGEPKLVDFGLVLANTRLFRTETGVARGTLPYMSPEQGAGQPVDRRSDVYGAAATLYELLTGVRAWPEGPLVGAPRPASEVAPHLPRALDAVLAKAMAREAEGRWPTAEAFCDALLEAGGVQPADEATVAAWVKSLAMDEAVAREASKETDRTATLPRERERSL